MNIYVKIPKIRVNTYNIRVFSRILIKFFLRKYAQVDTHFVRVITRNFLNITRL